MTVAMGAPAGGNIYGIERLLYESGPIGRTGVLQAYYGCTSREEGVWKVAFL